MATALVTGAGVRLGKAIARGLASAGFDLVLHVNASRAGAEEVAVEARSMGRRAEIVVADLSTEAGLGTLADAVLQLAPTLDVLVHNAGLFEQVPFESVTRAQFDRMLAVNLEAPFFLTQRLLPALRAAARDSGRSSCVVHLTDIGGERPLAKYAHYSVSKAGLIMLTRALAAELAPEIRVNAVSPGTVQFPPDFDDATKAAFLAKIPMAREGGADDVAKAVLFLVRDAPYVTGQILAIDGGRSAVL